VFRRIHPDASNPFHERSSLSKINNDLILAHLMPPGAVHTNNLKAVPTAPPAESCDGHQKSAMETSNRYNQVMDSLPTLIETRSAGPATSQDRRQT
jgi:hypothetical protein